MRLKGVSITNYYDTGLDRECTRRHVIALRFKNSFATSSNS